MQKEKKHLKLFGIELTYVLNACLLFGLLGWLVENIAIFFGKGVIDARYHILPIIPVYGLIVIAAIFIIGNPNDFAFFGKKLFKTKTKKTIILSNIISFLLICTVVFFAELSIGLFWENCFNVQLWDYSNLPFTVCNYAGLIPTIGYGIFGYAAIQLLNPLFKLMQNKLSYKTSFIINCIFLPLYILDDLQLYILMIFFNKTFMAWSIVF